MSRFERLLDLLQILRRHRQPVSGRALADDLGISLRTLYRDIASLQAQGAAIEGEAGVGYVLRPGFLLPPLMFAEEEIDALVLGARLVMRQGDQRLAAAARDALSKIAAVLPPGLSDSLADAPVLAGPTGEGPTGEGPAGEGLIDEADPALLRRAIRRQCKLVFCYRDQQGRDSRRTVWPCALGYFATVRVLVAWCELRGGFRHFRTDRIRDVSETGQRYPRRRQRLLAEWQAAEGIKIDSLP